MRQALQELPPDLTPYHAAMKRVAWEAGSLEWKLHAAQKIIHKAIAELPSGTKEAVLLCSRRFGKSYYGCIRALEIALQGDGKVVRIVGPTIDQTKGIVDYNMAKITAELRQIGLDDLVRPIRSENAYLAGESWIFLGGYDSQRDNMRGGEAHEILIEETGSSDPDRYAYQMRDVLKPQLLKTRGRMIHLTTLPPVPDHPFTLETIPQAQLDGAFYSYTIYEDPLATPEIIADAIKDSGGKDSDTFKREYLNMQIRDRSIVIIPDYDEKTDVEAVIPPETTIYETFTDWGGVRDLTVSLLMTYDYLRGVDYVLDELWWPHNTPTEDIIRGVREKWGKIPVKRHVADAPGQLLVDLKRSHNFDATLPLKDDFEAAVNNMANRFTLRKVKIHPQCALLRQTCRSGVLNKNRTDFDRSTVLGHMDAAAALMYGIRGLNRTNPYSLEVSSGEWQHIPRKATQASPAQGILPVPTSFGARGRRRFGT